MADEQEDRKKQNKRQPGPMGGLRGKGPMGGLGNPPKKKKTLKDLEPIIIDLSKAKDGSSIFKIVESKAKGGRAGYKGGGMSQRGLGRAFMKGGKV